MHGIEPPSMPHCVAQHSPDSSERLAAKAAPSRSRSLFILGCFPLLNCVHFHQTAFVEIHVPAKQSQLVLSAIGKDQTGIVDRLTRAIYDLELNICDSRMTVLGGEFAVQMLVEGAWNQIAMLETMLPELESKLGLTIHGKRTDIRITDKRIRPYAADVVALDHPGIVHHLASFFSRHHINIEEMNTTSYAAAHTGTPMFAVHLQIGVPADIQIASLRDEFMDFCDSMNLDAVLEPMKI